MTVVAPHTPTEGHADEEQQLMELLPMVKRMAAKMRRRLPGHVEMDDLVGEGVIGLVDAFRKFDARRRVKVETYVQHRIRGAMLDGLRSLDSVSRDMRKKNKNAEEKHRLLEAQLGRPVQDDEMARAMGISLKAWHRTTRQLQVVGLEWMRPMAGTGVNQISEENLADDREPSPMDLCFRREQRDLLKRALDRLSEREQRVVRLYYDRELTMKQIGAKLRIDESRVSQLHSGAIARLRSGIRALLRGSGCAANPFHRSNAVGDRGDSVPLFAATRVSAPCSV